MKNIIPSKDYWLATHLKKEEKKGALIVTNAQETPVYQTIEGSKILIKGYPIKIELDGKIHYLIHNSDIIAYIEDKDIIGETHEEQKE